MKTEGICEMCGHHVGVRQKAHIMAEGTKHANNVLLLCPTCHIMFDTHLKPRIFSAFLDSNLGRMPESWKKSIYEQAAEASALVRKRKRSIEQGAAPNSGPATALSNSGVTEGPPSVS
jgi:hypothetical protein